MLTTLDQIEMNSDVYDLFLPIKNYPISVLVFDEKELATITAEEVEQRIQADVQEILVENSDDLMHDLSIITSPCIYGVLFMIYAVAIRRVTM